MHLFFTISLNISLSLLKYYLPECLLRLPVSRCPLVCEWGHTENVETFLESWHVFWKLVPTYFCLFLFGFWKYVSVDVTSLKKSYRFWGLKIIDRTIKNKHSCSFQFLFINIEVFCENSACSFIQDCPSIRGINKSERRALRL